MNIFIVKLVIKASSSLLIIVGYMIKKAYKKLQKEYNTWIHSDIEKM